MFGDRQVKDCINILANSDRLNILYPNEFQSWLPHLATYTSTSREAISRIVIIVSAPVQRIGYFWIFGLGWSEGGLGLGLGLDNIQNSLNFWITPHPIQIQHVWDLERFRTSDTLQHLTNGQIKVRYIWYDLFFNIKCSMDTRNVSVDPFSIHSDL